MADRVASRVIVHGKVQGVWFRDTARHEATERGVTGWIRNRSDGTVEAWLEGPPQAVASMREWCGKGPPRAQVERVEAHDEEPRGLHGFAVR
jgi:acylphosphatase